MLHFASSFHMLTIEKARYYVVTYTIARKVSHIAVILH